MRIITNWRYHALMAVATVAVLGICSVPQSDGWQWCFGMVISKGIGCAAAYAFYRMMKKWLGNGSIPELEEMVKEE
jgi:hypothetical protein